MKKIALIIVLSLFAMPAQAGILYFDGFENGLHYDNTGPHVGGSHCCSHSLTTGTINDEYPINTGTYSFRSYVRSDDPAVQGHSARAELSGYNGVTFGGERYDSWYNTRWYGFSVYMPDRGSNYTYTGAGVFFQFHQYGDSSGIPFVIGMKTMGGEPSWYAYGHNPSYTTYFSVDATNDLGKWTDFIIEVDWGKDNNWIGVFNVWKNGELIFNENPFHNNTDGRDQTYAPYVKIGIDYPGTVDDYPVIAYHDNFIVGDENSSLSEMQESMDVGVLLEEIRADVNQDSQINSTDAMLTLRNSLGLDMSGTNWQSSATTGDVNCDGNSNSTDAMLILRYSLGLSMSGTGWCEE